MTALRPRVARTLVALALVASTAGGLAAQQDDAADERARAAHTLDRLIWTAAGLQNLLASRDYPNALLLGLVSRATARDAPIAGLAGLPEPGATREACRATADAVRGTTCALRELGARVPRSLAGDLADEAARLVALATRVPASATTGLDAWAAGGTDALQAYVVSALEPVWHGGRSEGSNGEAVAHLAMRLTGVDPQAKAADILGVAAPLRELVERVGGADSFTPGVAADRLLAAQERFLAETLDGLRGLLRSPVDAGEARVDWAARRSFAWLMGSALSAAGPELGETADVARTLGSAAADLRRAASQFPRSLSSFGQSAAVLALGGNVLGVAANVTSFFSAVGIAGPTTGRQVRALRAAVDTLRSELADRLDRVDASLDGLFVALDTNFGRLERAVGASQRANAAELAAIHGDVLALGRALERVDENLHSYMQAGFDRDYNRSLVRCLEHRERHLPPMDVMDFPTFSGCLTEFRIRAVRDARDAILTDQTTPYDDASVAAALSDLSPANLGRRLPLLGRIARDRFGNPGLMVRGAIANPVEWAIAAQAYLTVLSDWPDHARAVSTGDLDAMLGVGHDLRETLRNIVVTSNGMPRTDFFDAILARYEAAADSLHTRVAQLARRTEDDRLQRVHVDSVIRVIEPAEPGRPALPSARTVSGLVPPELPAAHALGLGSLSLRYRLVFTDSVARENLSRNGRDHDRVTWTTAHITVDVLHSTEGRIAVLEASAAPFRRRTEAVTGDPRNPRVRRTTEHVADPWPLFSAELWPALANARDWLATVDNDAVSRVRDRLDAALKNHAAVEVDALVLSSCAATPARAETASLQRALQAMTAAKGLIDAYVLFGLARSVQTHEDLRAALFGEEAVFGGDALCAAVRGGDSVVRLVLVNEAPHERLDRLREVLTDILSQPQSLPEPLDLVERTLYQLEAAREIQSLRVRAALGRPPAPAGYDRSEP